MSVVILSFLLAGILLCSLWFHDVWYPPEGRVKRKTWGHCLDSIAGKYMSNNQHAMLRPYQTWRRPCREPLQLYEER